MAALGYHCKVASYHLCMLLLIAVISVLCFRYQDSSGAVQRLSNTTQYNFQDFISSLTSPKPTAVVKYCCPSSGVIGRDSLGLCVYGGRMVAVYRFFNKWNKNK